MQHQGRGDGPATDGTGPPIPLDVANKLGNAIDLLNQEEYKKNEQHREYMDSIKMNFLNTHILKNPYDVPEQHTYAALEYPAASGLAMSYLMRDKGYSTKAQETYEKEKVKNVKQSILGESLNKFFLGNTPQLKSDEFRMDPVQYADSVLSKYSKACEQKIGELKSMSSYSLNNKKLSYLSQPQQPKSISVQIRTLNKSIQIYKQLLEAPVSVETTIFTQALNAHQASHFLLGDIQDAVSNDNKEVSMAISLVREGYQQSFCDQKAGEFLLTAEISRLKYELYLTNLAKEYLRYHAIEVILSLEEKRKVNEQQLQEYITQIEHKRNSEVGALLYRTQDYTGQVATLRAIVTSIKEDQGVMQVQQLRKDVDTLQEENHNLRQALEAARSDYNKLLGEYNEHRLNTATAEERVYQLREYLKYLQERQNICKNCQHLIEGQLAAEKDSLVERINDGLNLLEELKHYRLMAASPGPQPEGAGSTVPDDAQQKILHLDFIYLLQRQERIDQGLKALPEIKKLQEQIANLYGYLEQMHALKAELSETKKTYRDLLLRQEVETTATTGDEQDAQRSPASNTTEPAAVLMRNQPLYLVLSKVLDIQIVGANVSDPLYLAKHEQNPTATSCGYVAEIIHYFALQSALLVLDRRRSHSSSVVLFSYFVRAQISTSRAPAEAQAHHLIVLNKVHAVLQKFKHRDPLATDDSSHLNLGHFLLNSGISSDEFTFAIYVYCLSRGGVTNDELITIDNIRLYASPTCEFMSIYRASSIIGYLLSAHTYTGFMEKLLYYGEAAGLVRWVLGGELATHGIRDSMFPVVMDDTRVQIISVTYFVICMTRCYRAETATRLEALRAIYAGRLLECPQKLTEPARYRVVYYLLGAICPNNPQQCDQAYLDCIFRSPMAAWSSLVDSCRTAGVFDRALQLPAVDALIQYTGGFQIQEQKLNYYGHVTRVSNIIRAIQYKVTACKKHYAASCALNETFDRLEEVFGEVVDQDNVHLIVVTLHGLLSELNRYLFNWLYLGCAGDNTIEREIRQLDAQARTFIESQ